MKQQKEYSGIAVMAGLIGLVRPLLGWMCLAVVLGCAGNLAASFLTVFGGYGLLTAMGLYEGMAFPAIAGCIVLFAVFRGILRYGEQACNHYIAFKLLARIRHQVFAALRRLAPAKLDGSGKGNLISIITSDVELLEVFYAHTVSPVAIAVVTSIVMILYQGSRHPLLGALAACFYLIVGAALPVWNSRAGGRMGWQYRESFGNLNTAVLDNLYGLDEILQYQQKERRMSALSENNTKLEQISGKLKCAEENQQAATDAVILGAGICMLLVCGVLIQTGELSFAEGMTSAIAMMSSFGPTAALAALSNNLQHTLASGNRVLKLLKEEPVVEEITGGQPLPKRGDGAERDCEISDDVGICCEKVSFGYFGYQNGGEAREVLKNFSARFQTGQIHGIFGPSGCGKSTMLKLLMRFYAAQSGTIAYRGIDLEQIRTESLRRHVSYVTQETFLFHDTIENNIKVANLAATRAQVEEAARKASIHEFIMTLPNGYDTKVSELGDSLSGGERQRIGIARAFLHDSEFIFLDEPTSNIDSLNEGMILESLEQEKEGKTILLVSHRKSTMGIAGNVRKMEKG